MRTHLLLLPTLLLAACGDPDDTGVDTDGPTDTTPPETGDTGTTATEPLPRWPVVDVIPDVERIHAGPVDAALPAGQGWVGLWDRERRWITADGVEIGLGPGAVPRAAVEAAGTLWWLDDAGISVRVGGQLVDAGLGDLLPGVPTGLEARGDDVWIETDGGLCVWRAEVLSLVSIDGAPAEGPAAPGATLFGEDVTWIAHRGSVHALGNEGSAWKILESHEIGAAITGVRVVGDEVFVTAAGRLHVRGAEGWGRVRTDDELVGLVGGTRGAWALSEVGPRFLSDGELQQANPLADTEGRWWADELGRLLVRTADGVDRVSVHRPIRVVGLEEGELVDVPRLVSLFPVAPSEVDQLTARLTHATEAAAPMPVTDGVVAVDPTGLLPGTWTFEATATYPGRDPSVVRLPFQLRASGGIGWEEHVEPIHVASCAVCHEDSADTVLDGPEAWEAEIDAILDNVSSGRMPLGGPPLSEGQVLLIEGWRDGGFLP